MFLIRILGNVCMLSRVQLFVTLWAVACQPPLSMGFSRQEYWSGLPCPPPGDLLTHGSNLHLLHFRQILHHLSHQGSPFQGINNHKTLLCGITTLKTKEGGKGICSFHICPDNCTGILTAAMFRIRKNRKSFKYLSVRRQINFEYFIFPYK